MGERGSGDAVSSLDRGQRDFGASSDATPYSAGRPVVIGSLAAATGEPPTLIIAAWGIPTALVGLACLRHHST